MVLLWNCCEKLLLECLVIRMLLRRKTDREASSNIKAPNEHGATSPSVTSPKHTHDPPQDKPPFMTTQTFLWCSSLYPCSSERLPSALLYASSFLLCLQVSLVSVSSLSFSQVGVMWRSAFERLWAPWCRFTHPDHEQHLIIFHSHSRSNTQHTHVH